MRESRTEIDAAFGARSWWHEGLTHEGNLANLIAHETEFERREAFAYALVDLSGHVYLGCAYVRPMRMSTLEVRSLAVQPFDARVYFWLAAGQSLVDDATAFATLRSWMADCWPFTAVVFPGRSMSWDDWASRE